MEPTPWAYTRACHFFDTAAAMGWDAVHGGLVYCNAPDAGAACAPCDSDKYKWVQAEGVTAAALCAAAAAAAGDARRAAHYWDWYDRLWAYCWRHFVDHRHGAWYRILSADNVKYGDDKSPPGKVDYHNIGGCFDCLAALPPA